MTEGLQAVKSYYQMTIALKRNFEINQQSIFKTDIGKRISFKIKRKNVILKLRSK